MRQASAGDLFEIETSRLAKDKARNADLKSFAGEMLKDHAE